MPDKSEPILALVVPLFNEEEIIEDTYNILDNLLSKMIEEKIISPESYITFVDDGSKDKTRELLRQICSSNKKVKGILFACNFGHQKAILAGMTQNEADIYITIDADLQDDIEQIPIMIKKYKEKSVDIVYGVRKSRKKDTLCKKYTAYLFYKTAHFMGLKGIEDHADFRLVSRKVVKVLENIKEYNLYLRGLIYNLGFQYDIVYYDRKMREKGYSKYSFLKMLNLAFDGITSFSNAPIRFIFLLSLIFFLSSFILESKTFFMGAINLFATGLIGEYILKTYIESKQRPNFVIVEKIN